MSNPIFTQNPVGGPAFRGRRPNTGLKQAMGERAESPRPVRPRPRRMMGRKHQRGRIVAVRGVGCTFSLSCRAGVRVTSPTGRRGPPQVAPRLANGCRHGRMREQMASRGAVRQATTGRAGPSRLQYLLRHQSVGTSGTMQKFWTPGMSARRGDVGCSAGTRRAKGAGPGLILNHNRGHYRFSDDIVHKRL